MNKFLLTNCYVSKEGVNYICGLVLTSDGNAWRGSGKNNFPFRIAVDANFFNDCCKKIANPVILDVVVVGMDAFGNVLFALKR